MSAGGIPAASSSSIGILWSLAIAKFFCSLSPEIGGVDHRGVFVDGVGEFFRRVHENQFAPVSRMALSNALRPPTMMTSCFRPVVSGSCQMFLSSVPAMHPAVAAAMAPAEPEVTMPDSAPVSSDKRRPTARCRSMHVDKMLCRFHLRLADFGKFERAAQVGPGAATVDTVFTPSRV